MLFRNFVANLFFLFFASDIQNFRKSANGPPSAVPCLAIQSLPGQTCTIILQGEMGSIRGSFVANPPVFFAASPRSDVGWGSPINGSEGSSYSSREGTRLDLGSISFSATGERTGSGGEAEPW